MRDWYPMKVGWLIAIVVWTSAMQTFAQQHVQTNHLASGRNTVEVPSSAPLFVQLTESSDSNTAEHVVVKRTIRVSGPLVGPAKAHSASDFSKRVAHLFSPFASDDLRSPTEASGPTNARAWSTIVGWGPRASSFPTDSRHEPPELRLLSFSIEKQP
jgi:hypothetical protein